MGDKEGITTAQITGIRPSGAGRGELLTSHVAALNQLSNMSHQGNQGTPEHIDVNAIENANEEEPPQHNAESHILHPEGEGEEEQGVSASDRAAMNMFSKHAELFAHQLAKAMTDQMSLQARKPNQTPFPPSQGDLASRNASVTHDGYGRRDSQVSMQSAAGVAMGFEEPPRPLYLTREKGADRAVPAPFDLFKKQHHDTVNHMDMLKMHRDTLKMQIEAKNDPTKQAEYDLFLQNQLATVNLSYAHVASAAEKIKSQKALLNPKFLVPKELPPEANNGIAIVPSTKEIVAQVGECIPGGTQTVEQCFTKLIRMGHSNYFRYHDYLRALSVVMKGEYLSEFDEMVKQNLGFAEIMAMFAERYIKLETPQMADAKIDKFQRRKSETMEATMARLQLLITASHALYPDEILTQRSATIVRDATMKFIGPKTREKLQEMQFASRNSGLTMDLESIMEAVAQYEQQYNEIPKEDSQKLSELNAISTASRYHGSDGRRLMAEKQKDVRRRDLDKVSKTRRNDQVMANRKIFTNDDEPMKEAVVNKPNPPPKTDTSKKVQSKLDEVNRSLKTMSDVFMQTAREAQNRASAQASHDTRKQWSSGQPKGAQGQAKGKNPQPQTKKGRLPIQANSYNPQNQASYGRPKPENYGGRPYNDKNPNTQVAKYVTFDRSMHRVNAVKPMNRRDYATRRQGVMLGTVCKKCMNAHKPEYCVYLTEGQFQCQRCTRGYHEVNHCLGPLLTNTDTGALYVAESIFEEQAPEPPFDPESEIDLTKGRPSNLNTIEIVDKSEKSDSAVHMRPFKY